MPNDTPKQPAGAPPKQCDNAWLRRVNVTVTVYAFDNERAWSKFLDLLDSDLEGKLPRWTPCAQRTCTSNKKSCKFQYAIAIQSITQKPTPIPEGPDDPAYIREYEYTFIADVWVGCFCLDVNWHQPKVHVS